MSTGESIQIKVQPYFPITGEKVTSLPDGKVYILKEQLGTKKAAAEAAKRKERAANKRKIGVVSKSVCQMKDCKVRQKATSVAKNVKSLQNMTTYKTSKLAKRCPPSDTFLITHDCIAP